MKFIYQNHPMHCHQCLRSLVGSPVFDVFSESGAVNLGIVAKHKKDPKQWVAAPFNKTQNIVLKRGFKNKAEATEYLYNCAVLNAL